MGNSVSFYPYLVQNQQIDPRNFRELLALSLDSSGIQLDGFFSDYHPQNGRERPSSAFVKSADDHFDLLEELSDIEDDDDSNSENDPDSTAATTVGDNCKRSSAGTPQRASVLPRMKFVLDLDNTVLNTANRQKLNNVDINLADYINKDSTQPELVRFTLPWAPQKVYYIKFRPGVHWFLKEVSRFCDLAIHTNATSEYADIVLSVLDPDRSLFEARVAGREKNERKDPPGKQDRKEMQRLFGGDKIDVENIVVYDDRTDVWDAVFLRNIVQSSVYDYFVSRTQQLIKKYEGQTPGEIKNAAAGADSDDLLDVYIPDNLLRPDNAEKHKSFTDLRDLDRELYYVAAVLRDVAEARAKCFESGLPVLSVPIGLEQRKARILEGCIILLTGFNKSAPLDGSGVITQDSSVFHRDKLIRMGAKVVEGLTSPEFITHVVSLKQTITADKARQTCPSTTKFVHHLWIYACESTWSNVPSEYFESSDLCKRYGECFPSHPQIEHWVYTYKYWEQTFWRNRSKGSTEASESIVRNPAPSGKIAPPSSPVSSGSSSSGNEDNPGAWESMRKRKRRQSFEPHSAGTSAEKKRKSDTRTEVSHSSNNTGDEKRSVTAETGSTTTGAPSTAAPTPGSITAAGLLLSEGKASQQKLHGSYDCRSGSVDLGDKGRARSPGMRTRIREWLGTVHSCEGAQVWLPHEHISLRFDPAKSQSLYKRPLKGYFTPPCARV